MLLADACARAADAARAGAALDAATCRTRRSLMLALLLGALGAPYFAAQRVIVPELLGEDESTVGQANALSQGAIRTTLLLGPPLAGVLIGVFGAATVLVIDAATYVVSFLLVALFVPSRRRAPAAEESRGLLSGFRFLAHEPLLRVWTPLFLARRRRVAGVLRRGAGARRSSASAPTRRSRALLFAAFGAGSLCGNFLSFRFLTDRIDGLRLVACRSRSRRCRCGCCRLDVGAAVLFLAVLRERRRERHLQSEHPHDHDAADAAGAPAEGDCGDGHAVGHRAAARACSSRARCSPPSARSRSSSAFAAVQTVRCSASRARRSAPGAALRAARGPIYRLAARSARSPSPSARRSPACSQSFAPAAASDHVSSRPKRGARICDDGEPRRGPRAARSGCR